MGEISAFLRERAEAAIATGVARDRIVVDPGFGFGKSREHNLEILPKSGFAETRLSDGDRLEVVHFVGGG